nr:MAG TPA: hypothetical protein [Caudoviricetes sp.]
MKSYKEFLCAFLDNSPYVAGQIHCDRLTIVPCNLINL